MPAAVGQALVPCMSQALLSTSLVFADDGRLHKAVRVDHGVHIIEEIRLFPVGQPVLQLLLDENQAGAGHGNSRAGWGGCCGLSLHGGWGGLGCTGAEPAAQLWGHR